MLNCIKEDLSHVILNIQGNKAYTKHKDFFCYYITKKMPFFN